MILRELVRKVRLVFRAADNLLKSSRVGSAIRAGLHATAQSFGLVLHQLWLEVTGFVFLAIAALGAVAGMREYAKFQSHQVAGPGRLLLAICFTVSFAWFGLSSFWRVKRRRKA